MSIEAWLSLASVVVALGGFAALFVYLGRWGQRLEGRIDALARRIDAFAVWGAGFSKEVSAFFGLTVLLLHRRQALSDDELSDVASRMGGLSAPAVDALFERERRSANPLTAEELQRLRMYVDRARAGQWFVPDEVQDYNYLVGILEREKPTDPGVWPLVALGAFLLGLYMARQKDKSA